MAQCAAFQIVEESQQVYDQTGEIILTQTEYRFCSHSVENKATHTKTDSAQSLV